VALVDTDGEVVAEALATVVTTMGVAAREEAVAAVAADAPVASVGAAAARDTLAGAVAAAVVVPVVPPQAASYVSTLTLPA